MPRLPAPDTALVAFDLDGTLIDGMIYVWKCLHEHFRTDEVRRRNAALEFFAGRTSYAAWFENDLVLLREQDATRDEMLRCFEGLKLAQGALETLTGLRDRGYRTAVVSGSLDLLFDHFLPRELFDHVLINHIVFDEHGRILGGTPTPYDLDGKASGLAELARREGLRLTQCVFVGDNVNDLAVLRRAGFGVGIRPKHPDVIVTADAIIGELTELLDLLPARAGIA